MERTDPASPSERPPLRPPTDSPAPVFDVYGFRFTIRSSSSWALEGISQDFAYFRSTTPGHAVVIEMEDSDPDYSALPVCDASVYTPRNVVYRSGSTRYVDYGGRGIGVHDTVSGGFRITSRDRDLLYEAVYLFLLSQIGQYVDAKRLHRLHALAVSLDGRAILVLLPMGGGKSTLCAALLDWPEIKLLSDDSPMIDRRGRSLAFPLHLGLLKGQEDEIPAQYRRVVQRMEFGHKVLVNLDYYRDRICGSAEPGLVLLGRRTLAAGCRIERTGFTTGLRAMIGNCVIGLGLFQGLEFILQSSPWELISKAGVGLSRLNNCSHLLRRSEVHILHLGRDPQANAAAIVKLARERFSKPPGNR